VHRKKEKTTETKKNEKGDKRKKRRKMKDRENGDWYEGSCEVEGGTKRKH